MKTRKLRIVGVVVVALAIWWTIARLSDKRTLDEVRYDELGKARLWERRFVVWQMKPWVGKLLKVTRFNPVVHYAKKAELLEASLLKSGALVYVSFYRPSALSPGSITNFGRLPVPRSHPYTPSGLREDRYVKGWDFGDEISILCRPSDVAYWASMSCCITNRVIFGKLYKLVDNREETECLLPDGQTVDVQACHYWLNDSIAAGWMVGVCASNRVLIVSRQKPRFESN